MIVQIGTFGHANQEGAQVEWIRASGLERSGSALFGVRPQIDTGGCRLRKTDCRKERD
jgi:hypothetical protein